jgi:histidyl-tRNA synthetase
VSDPEPTRPTDVAHSGPFRAPVGVHDVIPPDSARWEVLVAAFATTVGRAGFGLCQSPMFEDIGVFARMGEGTDVVTKEMYEFRDRGDRHLALRPEGTASVVRAFVEHRPTTPWKVWYASPVFRYEKPQSGRYRQHHQLGVEAIGSADPDLDVEVMVLLADFYAAIGLRQTPLVLNTLGTPAQRVGYAAVLSEWFAQHLGDLDPADQPKVAEHPLRVLDSKKRATRSVVANAPSILDSLDDAALAHFDRVQAGLAAAGVSFTVDPLLVRGLDYYTHTLFEFRSPALSDAQNTIGGGGRFDGLVEALGGPATPAVGFGTGIERVLLACDAEGALEAPASRVQVFVVDVVDGESARSITTELRRAGIGADRAYDGRSMKAQMKAADRSGALWAAIVGADEAEGATVTLRPLRSDGQQTAVARADLVDAVQQRLANP